MTRIPRIWSIARFEFLGTVRRPAYLLALALLPLTCIGLGMLAMRVVGRPHDAPTQIELVDHSGLDFGPDASEVKMQPSLQSAVADLSQGKVVAVFELPDDYITSGRVICYRRETLLPTRLPPAQLNALTERLQQRLSASIPDPAVRNRLVHPVQLQEVMIGANAQSAIPQSSGSASDRTNRMIAVVVLALGLIGLLSFSSGYFLQSVSTERENHVIDVIRFSVTPYELMLGKLIGLSAACLAPTLLYVAISGAGTAWHLPVSHARIALLAVFLPLSYLFLATLMVATGMLIDATRESNLIGVFASILAIAPVIGFVSGRVWLLDALTYFPLTSPMTMILRICLGSVTAFQAILAAAILAVSTWACLSAAAFVMDRLTQKAGPRADLLQLL
jgi:ABC-2 type transport system permease protein